MLKTLNYKQRKILWAAIMLTAFYIAYSFSFKQAIGAIVTYKELTKAAHTESFSAGATLQITRKNTFYLSVLKGYKIRRNDSENYIWQSVSGMAISKDVLIGFNPDDKSVHLDTSQLTKKVLIKSFMVKGNFFNITKFLDTLSRSKGIGRLSAVNLSAKKETSPDIKKSDQLNLSFTLLGRTY